jgi:hypothetical protein
MKLSLGVVEMIELPKRSTRLASCTHGDSPEVGDVICRDSDVVIVSKMSLPSSCDWIFPYDPFVGAWHQRRCIKFAKKEESGTHSHPNNTQDWIGEEKKEILPCNPSASRRLICMSYGTDKELFR